VAVSAGLLVLGALAFALLASKGAGGGSPSDAATATQTQSAVQSGAAGDDFQGAELPGSRPAPAIELTDQYGRAVSLSRFRGQPVLVAFLYTSCGAQCVLIANQIRGALNELRKPIPVLLVSADPAADTPAAVRHFLAGVSLSGRVYYLTGSTAQLEPIWRAYRIRPGTEGERAFASSVSVLLVDAKGAERVLYGVEQLTPEGLAHDISRLDGGSTGP
jgi:protein SCO1/2